MKRILKLFKPNRIDKHLMFLLLLSCAAVFLPLVVGSLLEIGEDSAYLVGFIPITALLISATTSLGTKNLGELWRAWPFAIGIAGCCVLTYVLSRMSGLFVTFPEQEMQSFDGTVFAWLAVAVVLGFCYSRLLGLGVAKWLVGDNRFKFSRQRGIVVFALALFVFAALISYRNSGHVTRRFGINYSGWIMPVFLLPLIVGAIPCWIIQLSKTTSRSIFLPVFYFGLVGLSLFALSTDQLAFNIRLALGLLFYSIFFLIGSWLIRQSESEEKSPTEGGEEQSSAATIRFGRRIPRFWGLVAALLMIGVCTIGLLFDGATLVIWPDQDRWVVSRAVRRIQTSRGVDTASDASWMLGTRLFAIDSSFRENADPLCLVPLNTLSNVTAYPTFRYLRPNIDLQSLRNVTLGNVFLHKSTITRKQLFELSQGTHLVFDRSELNPEGDLVVPATGLQLHIYYPKPGQIAALLNSLQLEGKLNEIWIVGDSKMPFSKLDWETMVLKSRWAKIKIQSGVVDVPDYAFELAASQADELNLVFESGFGLVEGERIYTQSEWKLLIDSQIGINRTVVLEPNLNQQLWDDLFVRRIRRQRTDEFRESNYFDVSKPFRPQALQFHWAVATNENGDSITSFYCPFSDAKIVQAVGQLTELEVLSFDNDWLPATKSLPFEVASVRIQTMLDVSGLARLTKLKRLILPQEMRVASLRFMQSLPELEHLQLDVRNVPVAGLNPMGFTSKICPSLKSIVIFGKPSNFIASELAKIKTLESVTLIDDGLAENELDCATKLMKTLGTELEVIVIHPSQYEPAIPESFKQHLNRVRKLVRERYLGDDKK